MDKMKALAALLRTDKPLGQGMAQDAADKMKTVPGYREYQMQKMSEGGQPVTLEEFIKGAR